MMHSIWPGKYWNWLIEQLKRNHTQLNPTDKAGIIDDVDAFNFAW